MGIAELGAVDTEAGRRRFPQDFPDTAACCAHDNALALVRRAAAAAKPKGKRPNFVRLRSPAPHKPVWDMLWSQPPPVDGDDVSDGAGASVAGSGHGEQDAAQEPPVDVGDVDVDLPSTGNTPAASGDGGDGDVDMVDGDSDAGSGTPPSHDVCVVRGAAYLDALVPKWPREASASVPPTATPTQSTLVMCNVQPWRHGEFERGTMVRGHGPLLCCARGHLLTLSWCVVCGFHSCACRPWTTYARGVGLGGSGVGWRSSEGLRMTARCVMR